MSDNENTARHGIYLPPELLDKYKSENKEHSIKVNKLMVDALTAYANASFGKKAMKIDDIEIMVVKILKKKGIIE